MLPIVLSPATAYATRPNIAFPGSQAQATAAEAAADVRIEDALDGYGLDGLDFAVAAGAIEVAT